MSASDHGRFRERFAEVGSGLRRVEGEPALRPSVAGLKLDTALDFSKLASFSPVQVEMKSVAERVKPEGGEGLKIEADLGRLDEGVRKILQQQKIDKVRRLVEEAQALIAKEQFRPALQLLEKALESDPGAGAILFLKAYCFFGMREYEGALEVLNRARESTPEPQTLVLILILQAACARAVTRALEAKVLELVKNRRSQEALALVEGALRRQPSNIGFLYHRCNLLWFMGRAREAKQAVLENLQRVGPENSGLFQELLNQIHLEENQQHIEDARSALRRRDSREALCRLDACRGVLAGNEQYEAVRAYAEEVMPRGLIGSWLARIRSAPSDDPKRQKVLLWLLSEELNAGITALNAKNFDRAAAAFAAASKIDPRCGIICYLHGLAVFEGYQQTLEKKLGNLDIERAITALTTASEDLWACSRMDHRLSQQGEGLRRIVEGHLAQLREVELVNQLIQRFNGLMEGLEHHPPSSEEDLERAERSFRELRQAVDSAKQSQPTKASQQELHQLLSGIDRNIEQVGELKKEIRLASAVNCCVQSFNDMMEHFQRNPIRNRNELERAKQRAQTIRIMVDAARGGVARGSDGRRVLDELEQALQRVEQQLNA